MDVRSYDSLEGIAVRRLPASNLGRRRSSFMQSTNQADADGFRVEAVAADLEDRRQQSFADDSVEEVFWTAQAGHGGRK